MSAADSKEVDADLTTIYMAHRIVAAELELETFSAKWDVKYLTISRQWQLRWPHAITLFEMPSPIRKVMHLKDLIKSIDTVVRRFTRNPKQVCNRDSDLKLDYLVIIEASNRWSKAIDRRKHVLNHFALMFEDRKPKLRD